MKIQNSYKLQISVLLGVAFFLSMVLANNLYQLQTLKTSEKNYQLLGEVRQLFEISKGFIRSSNNYQINAARDFESYNRDKQIFLKDLLEDMTHFSELLESLSNRTVNEAADIVPGPLQAVFGQKISKPHLQVVVSDTAREWERFYSRFMQRLGENEDEPRIEWGVEHILQNGMSVDDAVGKLTSTYENYLDEQAVLARRMSEAGILGIAILGLLGLVWFYQRITRRISQTAKACARVANGDFGYTLPVKGSDELTVLSRAFNLLSSRSEMVLALLSQLQDAKNLTDGLGAIVRTSGNYLPIAWCGMAIPQPDGSVQITSALPQATMQSLAAPVSSSSHLGGEINQSVSGGRGTILDNVKDLASRHQNDPHLQALAKTVKLESMLCLPMVNNQWKGVLLLGTRSGVYENHHKEFMEVLGPLMAISLSKV